GLIAVVSSAGVALGVVRRRSLPPIRRTRGFRMRRPTTLGGYFAVLFCAITLLLLVELLRGSYHEPLVAPDAWNFWVEKAKAIYFFGGLDEHLFRALPAP